MDHPRRVVLLVTSPRVPAGLLSRDAWRAIEDAATVLARSPDQPLAAALATAGVRVDIPEGAAARDLARELIDHADKGAVLWLGSPDADPGLADALAAKLTAHPDPPELEMLVGSWDLPGARLLDAVAVMDRLRSPGGCPWDAAQSHRSLTPYLIEEAHEVVEAIETGDRDHLVEELGDLLLQVLFHARVAEEHDEDPFDIDDVAAGLVAKLVRRHPHVFAPTTESATTAADVQATWEALKAVEKPDREHLLDGIPAGMPELARAAKVASRLDRAGRGEWLAARVAEDPDRSGGDAYGAMVMQLVLAARQDGVDLPAALRMLLRDIATDADPLSERR